MTLQLAQVNVARMQGPLESEVTAGFVARLDEINALADRSPGFVWRLQTGEGNATYLRPYDDDRILFNLSVWESLEHLREYVYRSAHVEVLRNRHEWFSKFDEHGPTPFAFTFRVTFPADPAAVEAVDWSAFEPCPATSGS